jgi:hypothetical protein
VLQAAIPMAVTTVLAAALLAACAGLAPGGNAGQVVDVAGIGTAEVASFDPPPRDQGGMNRWTGARAVLATEDGRLLVVWNGGPALCWGLVSVHFTARGPRVDASVGEWEIPHPGRCGAGRTLRAVFLPAGAAPANGQTSEWPITP